MRRNIIYFRSRFSRSAVLATFLAASFTLLSATSCTASRTAPSPSELAARGALRPWAHPDGLREGRELYRARCAACHGLPAPDELPADRWPGIVDAMAPRSGLDTTQARKILDWILLGDSLVASSARPIQETTP